MNPGKGIPFVDLITPHVELEEQLIEAVRSCLRTGGFIGGPALTEFESEFAKFSGTEYCIGVSSGTDALRFALMAAGIGPGDIVVTVPNTFVATVEAIVQTGATTHFVDVDPKSFNMSPDALRKYLQTGGGKNVKAIIPVHLYGQMCDMDALMALAEEYGLMVFEDACQAHGSEYFSNARNSTLKAGSVGKAAAFSFYPGKNLGACGEAGAVTTNDEAIAQRIRMIRDHGQNKKYYHLVEGYNGRLDAIQAAMLRVKLPHLAEWNAKRREAAARYTELLGGVESLTTPYESNRSGSVYHLYVVKALERDQLQARLTEKNIGTGLHYPVPVHLQKGYAHLGFQLGDFPIAERLASEILSLPIYPQIQAEQQQQVTETILEFYGTRKTETKVLTK
jgi:dTDP-4-amino-4,6-dideoxygalactose transaminase